MTQITIEISEALKDFVDRKAAKEGCTSAGEYVCGLIRDEQERENLRRKENEQKLEALQRDIKLGTDQLDRGEYTTHNTETHSQMIEEVKARGRERLAKLHKKSE